MKTRKKYQAPKLRSEKVKIGVFGQYGGGETGPVQLLFPLFGICCN